MVGFTDFKCRVCGEKLTFKNFGKVRGIDGKAQRVCRTCSDEYIKKLKEHSYIETYNGSDIYMLDGRYVPYWGCFYYFTCIEGCKERIDMKNCEVVWGAYG